jgi:hypothetical protein
VWFFDPQHWTTSIRKEFNMQNEENSVVTAENERALQDTGEKKNNVSNTLIDKIIELIASNTQNLVRYSDRKDTYANVKNILTTIFALCALDEYAVGITVKQTLYRYEDFSVLPALSRLLVAKKVVVRDVPSARNFLNNEKFCPREGEVLTPGEFLLAEKRVCTAMRSNPNYEQLSRSPIALLGEAASLVVSNKNVVDRTQDLIYFLDVKCDDEARVPIEEWCNTIASKLFF